MKRELGLDYFFKLIVFFFNVHFEALGFRLTFDYQKWPYLGDSMDFQMAPAQQS